MLEVRRGYRERLHSGRHVADLPSAKAMPRHMARGDTPKGPRHLMPSSAPYPTKAQVDRLVSNVVAAVGRTKHDVASVEVTADGVRVEFVGATANQELQPEHVEWA